MTTAAAQSPPAAARIKVTSDTDARKRSERSSALKRLGLGCHTAPKSVFSAVFLRRRMIQHNGHALTILFFLE